MVSFHLSVFVFCSTSPLSCSDALLAECVLENGGWSVCVSSSPRGCGLSSFWVFLHSPSFSFRLQSLLAWEHSHLISWRLSIGEKWPGCIHEGGGQSPPEEPPLLDLKVLPGDLVGFPSLLPPPSPSSEVHCPLFCDCMHTLLSPQAETTNGRTPAGIEKGPELSSGESSRCEVPSPLPAAWVLAVGGHRRLL